MEICEEVPVNSSSILTSLFNPNLSGVFKNIPAKLRFSTIPITVESFLPHNGFGFERNSGKGSFFHIINFRRTAIFSIVGLSKQPLSL